MPDRPRIAVLAAILALACLFATGAPAAPACVGDNAIVQMTGTIQKVENRDRITGQPYRYFIIDADAPWCVSGAEVDERSSTPTYFLVVLACDPQRADRELDPFVGRHVRIAGSLGASNGGGPQLACPTITEERRDN